MVLALLTVGEGSRAELAGDHYVGKIPIRGLLCLIAAAPLRRLRRFGG